MTTTHRADIASVLDSCAERLLAVGRVDLPDPGAALYCLTAANLLCANGAKAHRVEITGPVADTIRGVLVDLAQLPAAAFADPAIADAAAAARRALRCAQPEEDHDLAPDVGPAQ